MNPVCSVVIAAMVLASACGNALAADSTYSNYLDDWIKSGLAKWVKDEARGTIPKEHKTLWERVQIVTIADSTDRPCFSPEAPARAYLAGPQKVPVIEICVRYFRYVVDLSESATLFQLQQMANVPGSQDLFIEYGKYLQAEIAKDADRALTGKKQQTLCMYKAFIFLRENNIAYDKCADEALITKIGFADWDASLKFVPKKAVAAFTNGASRDEMKAFLADANQTSYAGLLLFLVLHEFAHHVNGDMLVNSKCDRDRIRCEQAADEYAYRIVLKIPNFRSTLYLNAAGTVMIYMNIVRDGASGTLRDRMKEGISRQVASIEKFIKEEPTFARQVKEQGLDKFLDDMKRGLRDF